MLEVNVREHVKIVGVLFCVLASDLFWANFCLSAFSTVETSHKLFLLFEVHFFLISSFPLFLKTQKIEKCWTVFVEQC